jgi:alpha-glucosidase
VSVGLPWWRRATIYQIYPRSFQDSNGDGIGDLPGVSARLDYLVWLGIDAIWLSPFYPSPMVDFGYDVADYCDVDPIFGTLADFDSLVAAAHARGLKVIVDFVPNHTSDRHPWFLESRGARENPKRDWYIWRDPAADGGPPNNWLGEFGGPAWTKDEGTGQYYYHAYLPQQPDLNWRNSDVRAAMQEALRFWLERGVDGFRLDTIHHLFEDEALRDNPLNPHFKTGMAPTTLFDRIHQVDQPEVQDVLRDFRRLTDSYGEDRILIGEAYLPLDKVMAYYGGPGENRGVHLPFNFQLIGAPWDAGFIASLISRYESLLPEHGWPNWVLGNHDRARVTSRFGATAAPLATMLLLTLRGTPTLYYGDELGLADVTIPPGMVQDPWEKRVPGFGLGRDPVRSPMPWDGTAGAGFTTGIPWLPLNDDAATRNVAALQGEKHNLLHLARDLLALRRAEPALNIGDYGLIESRSDLLLYERICGPRRLMIVLNMSASAQHTPVPSYELMLSTCRDRAGERADRLLRLRPQEGVILRITEQ